MQPELGMVLRKLRKEKKLRVIDFVGVSSAAVNRIENGLVDPRVSSIAAICRTLEIPVSTFFQMVQRSHIETCK